MKVVLALFCALFLMVDSYGQLVTKRDYDAAFAIQAGGEAGLLLPMKNINIGITPTAGLKMTFPFTRKWFMGGEINYSELKCKGSFDVSGFGFNGQAYVGNARMDCNIRKIQVPVYVKYMLNCNKASVLFGVYGAYLFDNDFRLTLKDALSEPPPYSSVVAERIGELGPVDLSGDVESWNAGIVVGYEHRIVKHLDVMLKVSAGAKELLKKNNSCGKRLYPLQASLTLSFDILRIGDCGCD